MDAQETLLETALFTAHQARVYTDAPDKSGPWLVTGAALMAQQAAALALKSASDVIPEQIGATELLLRAAHRDRLAAPYTLPFSPRARQAFDRLVERRNAVMHPRGLAWSVSRPVLAQGLQVAAQVVRHLILVQPIRPSLSASPEVLDEALRDVEALVDFLT